MPQSEVITFTQLITPDLAKGYLAKNTHNRNVQQSHVQALADAMRKGRWQITHQGIAFSEDGVLLDGQHRLLAVVESGVSVSMQVTMGLSSEALFGIDTNKVRTVAQNVQLQGYKYAKAVTAWTNVVKVLLLGGTERTWNTEDVLRIYDESTEIIQMAVSIPGLAQQPASIGAAYLFAAPKNPQRIHQFFSAVLSGVGLGANSPELSAHQYYFSSNKRGTDKRWEACAKLLRCAQAYLEGTALDARHIYASDGTVEYFGRALPASGLLGTAYASRRTFNRMGVALKRPPTTL